MNDSSCFQGAAGVKSALSGAWVFFACFFVVVVAGGSKMRLLCILKGRDGHAEPELTRRIYLAIF